MSSILFIICLVGFGYIFLIFHFYRNIPSEKIEKIWETYRKKTVTVIIPFRNEESNLLLLLDSLKNQTYPKDQVKILFINDHSEDNGQKTIEDFAFRNGEMIIDIIELEEGNTGKKAALQKAYQLIDSEIILSTDADCELQNDWISISVKAFDNEAIQMLCGGVKIEGSANWIKQFQSVDLMSLIGSGSAAIQMGQPIMSNGANLAFRTSILNDIDLTHIKAETPSGDDVFLLMEVAKTFGPKAIQFEFHTNHWVSTKAMHTFEELVQQRIRWTSKSKNYKNPFQIFTSVLIFLSNLSIPVLFIWSLFSLKITIILLFYWIFKLLIDFVFLNKVAKMSDQAFDLQKYINTAIFYPFFISYIAIIGQFTHFNWKGRNYQNK